MPAIFCDVDGVISVGTMSKPNPIGDPGTPMRKVLDTLKWGRKIPFVFLTNGGNESELSKANKMNSTLGFDLASDPKLSADNIILCHTMFRSK